MKLFVRPQGRFDLSSSVISMTPLGVEANSVHVLLRRKKCDSLCCRKNIADRSVPVTNVYGKGEPAKNGERSRSQ